MMGRRGMRRGCAPRTGISLEANLRAQGVELPRREALQAEKPEEKAKPKEKPSEE
jgi:hypothetical protein